MADETADVHGVVGGQRELHKTQFDRGMLDLRLQLIRMRTDYLNQITTQCTLLASCAVAMLMSSELHSLEVDEEEEAPGAVAPRIVVVSHWLRPLSPLFSVLYTACSCTALATSMWVIYTAMNLINLSIHSALNGKTMRALTEADNIIEARMREVRLVYVLSLGALLSATFTLLVSESTLPSALVGGIIFGFVVWHAITSDQGTITLYERFTGLETREWHRLLGVAGALPLEGVDDPSNEAAGGGGGGGGGGGSGGAPPPSPLKRQATAATMFVRTMRSPRSAPTTPRKK